jgi:hypothetical protein
VSAFRSVCGCRAQINRYGRPVPKSLPADSTLLDLRTVEQNVRGHRVRRGAVAVLALIVVAGAFGVFGMRSTSTHTSAQGYRLSVTYARVSRAGLDTPWRVTVRHPGGFSGPITLATTASYFSMFETQGLTPDPESDTIAGQYEYQEFSAPPGDTFTLIYDAYIQPASQRGRSGQTALIIDGHEITRVSYRTRLVP